MKSGSFLVGRFWKVRIACHVGQVCSKWTFYQFSVDVEYCRTCFWYIVGLAPSSRLRYHLRRVPRILLSAWPSWPTKLLYYYLLPVTRKAISDPAATWFLRLEVQYSSKLHVYFHKSYFTGWLLARCTNLITDCSSLQHRAECGKHVLCSGVELERLFL